MKSLKAQLSIAAVCIVLGLMLAYQFQNASNILNIYAGKQIDDLQQQLKDAQTQKQDLENSITDLQKKIDEYEKTASNANGYANSLKSTLDEVRQFAGQTDVEGPGVVITVSPVVSDLGNSLPVTVSASELQMLINELNACGAEAVMAFDQRIVSTTAIRDMTADSSIVQINGVSEPTTGPFEVKAIGDPATLEGGLKTVLVQAFSDYYGIDLKIEQQQKITIKAYNKVVNFKYAKPVKEGD